MNTKAQYKKEPVEPGDAPPTGLRHKEVVYPKCVYQIRQKISCEVPSLWFS